MKHKELQQALGLIAKVLVDPRVEPGQRNQLQKAKRELEVVARSGKLDHERIFRAVELLASVLLDIASHDATL